MPTAMGLQCYGASRVQDGGTTNEDAFWINRPQGDAAVVCDGAGRAQRCAASVAKLFSRHLVSGAMDVARFPAWRSWLTAMDAALLGGPQTTFVGMAVREGHVYGACAGNSRAYPPDLPPALLDVAGARGRGDDMTVVTLTARGQVRSPGEGRVRCARPPREGEPSWSGRVVAGAGWGDCVPVRQR